MMKKKSKTIILIILIIAIIISVTVFNTNKEKNIEKLANIYQKLCTSQEYMFIMKKNNNTKTIMAKKDHKTVIDKYSENSHDTTIVQNNTTYYILHNREEYHVYNQNDVEQNYLEEGMQAVIETSFSRGTEKINGKNYSYEEYNGSTIFMITNALDLENEATKTRFYFDNEGNLAYIRTISGVKQELLEIEIKTDVDNEIFEIPSNYAENLYN